MSTDQIQQYHLELTNRRINGEIQNNALIYCSGKARVRVLINDKWEEVIMSLEADNTAAINKMNKIIDKQVKTNASKTKNATPEK